MQNTEQNRPRGNISRTQISCDATLLPKTPLFSQLLLGLCKVFACFDFWASLFPLSPPALKCCLNLKYVETLNPPRDVHIVVLKLLRAGEITQTIMAR